MAFPGTYNISYYKGDTLEFNIYPKLADGSTFSLSDLRATSYYDDPDTTDASSGTNYSLETAGFWVSTARGSAGVSNRHQCFAQISNDGTHVKCAIRPGDASFFEAGTQYVYDVEVRNSSTPYNKVYTLLTGTITVTDHITGAS